MTECGGYALLWVAFFFGAESLEFTVLLVLPEVVADADAGHSWLVLRLLYSRQSLYGSNRGTATHRALSCKLFAPMAYVRSFGGVVGATFGASQRR